MLVPKSCAMANMCISCPRCVSLSSRWKYISLSASFPPACAWTDCAPGSRRTFDALACWAFNGAANAILRLSESQSQAEVASRRVPASCRIFFTSSLANLIPRRRYWLLRAAWRLLGPTSTTSGVLPTSNARATSRANARLSCTFRTAFFCPSASISSARPLTLPPRPRPPSCTTALALLEAPPPALDRSADAALPPSAARLALRDVSRETFALRSTPCPDTFLSGAPTDDARVLGLAPRQRSIHSRRLPGQSQHVRVGPPSGSMYVTWKLPRFST
ncbi:hypothetical protein T484DRAFT_1966759, partial [Baffinella frigidus]